MTWNWMAIIRQEEGPIESLGCEEIALYMSIASQMDSSNYNLPTTSSHVTAFFLYPSFYLKFNPISQWWCCYSALMFGKKRWALLEILPIQMYSMTSPPTVCKNKSNVKYHVSIWHKHIYNNLHIFNAPNTALCDRRPYKWGLNFKFLSSSPVIFLLSGCVRPLSWFVKHI